MGSIADPYSGLDEYSGPGGTFFRPPEPPKTHVFHSVTLPFNGQSMEGSHSLAVDVFWEISVNSVVFGALDGPGWPPR